ncbi:MAG TPA: 3-deoxy-7-phosphoheptulonate synthase [Trebonia sp.]|jgi:3-deoxy-7-phosphoheptulonate synthase|nr:3-deoxy-7-phosphoheptulonate synthase [Trebonia sp.]
MSDNHHTIAPAQPPAPRRPAVPSYQGVSSPAALLRAIPLGHGARVGEFRAAVRAVLDGTDDRLLVIAGPCSVHDPLAAVQYGQWLARRQAEYRGDLLLVMRAYVDKPRTLHGWKGLVNDPFLDGSGDVAAGLRTARALLVQLAADGVPAATEWVDPLLVPYLADAVTWGTIGARTTESQVHRRLASALAMPVGFKNSPDGDPQAAVDACVVAAGAHAFLGPGPADGAPAVTRSGGNRDTCVVLRGGRHGPNYQRSYVSATLSLLGLAGLDRRVVIDASHGNSGKNHHRQREVALAIAAQAGRDEEIAGVMLESFLVAGRQELAGDPATLAYGQSVTDACMGLDETGEVLAALAEAVARRRRSR